MQLTAELIRLFHENFPFAVRSEDTVQALLSAPDNHVLSRRDESGRLIAASASGDATVSGCESK